VHYRSGRGKELDRDAPLQQREGIAHRGLSHDADIINDSEHNYGLDHDSDL